MIIFFIMTVTMFFIMAMLAENDAALHGELQSGLDAAAATSSQYGAGYAAMRALFWLVQGQEAKASALIKTLRTSMPPGLPRPRDGRYWGCRRLASSSVFSVWPTTAFACAA